MFSHKIKISFSYLLFLLTLSGNYRVHADESALPKHVLIINSYHQGFEWTDEIVQSVSSLLTENLENLDLSIEYMDSKRHPDALFEETMTNYLKMKYREKIPDIIISSDDRALTYLKQVHTVLFPETPVVFCGVNDINNALSINSHFFTGIIEMLDMADNIALANLLNPSLEQIVIVTDGSPTGRGTRQMAKEAEPAFENLSFIYLNGESMRTQEMLEYIANLSENSMVIVPAWYLDKEGNTFDNKQIYPLIARNSSVPVIGTSSANLGLGIIGGKLNSGTIQGELSAQRALQILNGVASCAELGVDTRSQNQYFFDYEKLKQYGISRKTLPEGSQIINAPIPIYKKYPTETAIIFILLNFLIFIILLLFINMKNRQKKEAELQEKELRYRTLHNASFSGLCIIENDIILDCNQGLSHITGYSREELIGSPVFKTVIAPEWEEKVRQKISRLDETPYEIEGIKKNLVRYPLYTQSRASQYKGVPVRIAEFRDLSQRKKIEQEKLEMETKLLQGQKMESIGQLTGGIAHDFNNLLIPILGFSEMLASDANIDNKSKNRINQILQAALKAKELIKQLLAYSRKQILNYTAQDINRIISSFENLIRGVLKENINLEIIKGKDLPPLMADEGQIGQVLMNLVVNASDSMPEGGKLIIETKQSSDLEKNDQMLSQLNSENYILLKVSDTGRGMDKETLSKAFEPFYTTKGKKGTGLGLASVYGIIKQHKGYIYIDSELNSGTIVNIFLPTTDSEKTETTNISETKIPDKKGNELILLVEDDDSVRLTVNTLLESLGYQVKTAIDGNDALKMMSSLKPDLLLTDLVMPGINGKELYEELAKKHPHLKVLFMSGYTNNIFRQENIDISQYYLQKPFQKEDLLHKIREILDVLPVFPL